MNEWMNEWTNEWMNEWTNEWMNEWMNERMNEWRNEWMLVRSSVCMYVLNKSRHHLEGEMTISKEAAYHWHRNEHGDRCFNARASPHAQVSSLPSFQDAYKLGVKCVMRPQNIASEREETKAAYLYSIIQQVLANNFGISLLRGYVPQTPVRRAHGGHSSASPWALPRT